MLDKEHAYYKDPYQHYSPPPYRTFTAFRPSTMLPPGLQAGSAMATEEPKQRFLETNYIIRELASGLFGTVYISIPKTIADSLISDTTLSSSKLHSALRQNIQAAKISKSTSVSMAEEISVLKAMKKVKSSSASSSFTLPNLLDSDPSPNPSWLTLQYLNGGTLHDLLGLYYDQHSSPPPLPTSLLWHWISQMAQTLLYLHQGLTITTNTDGKPELHLDETWTPTIHNDIHRQNLIFNFSPSNRSYPDLILSDFGNSIRQDSSNPYPGFPWTNLKENEISSMLCELEQLVNTVDTPDEWLEVLFDRTPSFKRDGDENAENDAELEFLEKMIGLAERRKKECWKPMPEGLREYFGGKRVGEELEGFVQRLREEKLKRESSAESSSSSSSASSSENQDEKTPGCGCVAL